MAKAKKAMQYADLTDAKVEEHCAQLLGEIREGKWEGYVSEHSARFYSDFYVECLGALPPEDAPSLTDEEAQELLDRAEAVFEKLMA